jgi:alpha-glucosidase
MLLAVLATSRGTMLLYQGDELGLPDGNVPFECLRDPATRRFFPDHMQRDGARTPMPWSSSSDHAGFTTGVPWLPLGRGHAELALDRQEASADSTLSWARRLIALRRREPALRSGDCEFLDLAEPLLGYERITAGRRIQCIFNVAPTSTRLLGSAVPGNSVALSSGYQPGPDGQAEFAPFGFRVTVRDAE